LADRTAAAHERIRQGYDPEAENPSWSPRFISPRRSDAWCLCLGWADSIAAFALDAANEQAQTDIS
jgi:hypothetical protein